ncbi:MAG: invasion-associated locus B family protein [Rhodobacterales bacterium]|nr:MAG: invasion-associated locus B family protein [Rhodobacterales bacterium]
MTADLMKSLGVATLMALTTAGTAWAQDDSQAETGAATEAQVETPAEGAADTPPLDMGTEVTRELQPGQIYLAEKHGDWERRCVFNPEGVEPCQMYQLLKDTDGTPVAEFNLMRLPKGGQAVAGANFIAPLETLLTENLTLTVDSGGGKKYAFRLCTKQGCVVQMGLTAADVAAMKAGNVATATIVPAIAPDQRVNLPISLTGFTAAYDALPVPVIAPKE